jgi:myo-inositol-1-phosphate synthase
MPLITPGRVGLWLVGATGNVAVTVATGIAALRKKAVGRIGLCTESPPLQGLTLAGFSDIELGGHEIRPIDARSVVDRLTLTDRVIDTELRDLIQEDVYRYEHNIAQGAESGTELERLSDDIRRFAADKKLDRVVVVNCASTEAHGADLPTAEGDLRSALAGDALPMSCAYALAAFDAGAGYVNFTPSTGASGVVFDSLATERKLVHAGRDGKTGETLLKAALLPMFAARNLRVDSWFGQNILGNEDGRMLQEPERKDAKQATKSGLVEEILGYQPASHVGIDYVEPLGDWKVAWDHIMFRGFMGTQMNLQLTWRGADSILAAPLVIDLLRICDFCMRRGDSGLLTELGFFFKDPLGSSEHALMSQYQNLLSFLGAEA